MFRFRGQVASRFLQTSSRRHISTKVVENGRGVSELSLIVKGGSRFEPANGVAHLLRSTAFQDTAKRSGLRLQRESELLGGKLTTQLGKEHLVFTTEFLREDLPYFVEALGAAVTKPLFRSSQFNEEFVPHAKLVAQKARADPVYVAIENAYESAFRTGLAHPLLVSSDTPFNVDTVAEYASQVFTKDNVSLFARNVVAEDLSKFAGEDFAALGNGTPASEPSKVYNGEARVKSTGAQVAVLAFPTAGAPAPALDVLKYVLGARNVKWSPSFGLLNTLPVDVAVHHDIYSDASLFYVVLESTSPEAINEAAKSTAATLKSLASGVDETVAKKAIASAKFTAAEKADSLLSALKPTQDVASVTAKSISEAAKKLVEGKKVVSVVGKTYKLPYSDELF